MRKNKSEEKNAIAEYKKELVKEIINKINNKRSILVASAKNLPASQFQLIKKRLREMAEIVVAKKSILIRAISSIEKGALQNLKNTIGSNVVLIFSDIEPFELASILMENQTPTRAKVGDISQEDITIEPILTDLLPGPAISELGAVGLKVAVEGGKLAIKNTVTIVKKDETIDEKVANVLSKLRITPIKTGFIPLAAYDSQSDKFYSDIKIDKKATLNELHDAIKKSLGFAININYIIKETISYFITKAIGEEKALEKILEEK